MDEREVWKRFIGPDYDSDETYGLCCPECSTEIEEGEEVWYQKVAFCRTCLPKFKTRIKDQPERQPSEALMRLRKYLHGMARE